MIKIFSYRVHYAAFYADVPSNRAKALRPRGFRDYTHSYTPMLDCHLPKDRLPYNTVPHRPLYLL